MDHQNVPLHALMQATAELHPQRVALRFGDRAITFSEFDALSSQAAHGLLELGVRTGDRIGLLMPNCPEYEIAFWAGSKIGAILVPLNPSYTSREITFNVSEAGANVLIVHERLWPTVRSARAELRSVRWFVIVGEGADHESETCLWGRLIEGKSTRSPDFPVDPDQVLALPFSSGTTGLPKGVMLTHRNLAINHIQFREAARLKPGDALFVYLPMSHIYGVALMGMSMCTGVTQIILERFDLESVARLTAEHGVTLLHVVPPILLALASAPDLDPAKFRTVRYFLNAAAPLVPEVARRVERRFGIPVAQAYGMTESSPATHHSPLERDRMRMESVGVLVAHTEHRIVDLETGTTTLPPGETGELVVRGPQVMKGYWNAPEETARTIRDGWLYTGDIGYIDGDGYLYIVDRKKEMIKYRGFSIAPAEMEGVLMQHPDVADCAVVGVADPEHGELPKAFVVPKPGVQLDLNALDAFVAERAAGYKRIRVFAVAQSIPRTPSGKILRRLLKQD